MALRLIVFVGGAVLMSLELVGSRVLAPYFGNSIFVWGSLIGVFLSALSVGYYLGGILADRSPRVSTLSHCLASAALMVLCIPWAAGPINMWLDSRLGDPRLGSLLSALALFSAPSVLLGTISPYAIRLEAQSVSGMGSTAGSLYALSTAGSIAGTFGTSFVLIPALGVKSIIYLLGAVLLLLAAVGYSAGGSLRRAGSAAGLLAIVLALAFFWDVFGAYRMTPDLGLAKVVYEEDTLYHRLVILDQEGIRYMKFDDSMQSAMYLDRPQETPFEYVPRMALGLFFEPKPRRSLLIGLGAGSLPKLLMDHYPEMRMDVAEIDPAVIRAAREYFHLPDSDRLAIYPVDGRDYIEDSDVKYDLVFLDAYFADSIPFHLTTREFLLEVRENLHIDGAAVANIIGSVTGDNSRLFRAMYRTFASVFPQVYVFAKPVDEGSWISRPDAWQNLILVATVRSERLDPRSFSALPESLENGVSWVTPRDLLRYAEGLYEDRIDVGDVPLLTDDYAPLDSLLNVYTVKVTP